MYYCERKYRTKDPKRYARVQYYIDISVTEIKMKTDDVLLKVPKCEIFDPFFYTNKSYMGR
jgi:hypothetical protein